MKHKEGTFKGQKDVNLFYQCWLPDENPRAILLLVHGLAEHSGRYKNLVNYFEPRGFAIYSFDHRGHGKSEGLRSYVDRFSQYSADLKTFIEIVREGYPHTKIFVIGHSLGATIAISYAIEHQHALDGMILSGATLIASSTVSPLVLAIVGVLSALLPRLGVATIDASTINRNQAFVDAYLNDALVYHDKIPARTGAELAHEWKTLPSQFAKLTLPMLIMHGSADRLANPRGSTLLHEQARSKDKTLTIYEGFYHEIFNESDYGQVMADIEAWLTKRV
jgi:acylglycerol lipase